MIKRALIVTAAATFAALGLIAAPAAADDYATGDSYQALNYWDH